MPNNAFRGRCHCGAIGFVYSCPTDPGNWSIRACQCRFCRAHDALSTSAPEASIAFRAIQPDRLQRYRFGLKTADFLICTNCGVYIGAVIETDEGRYGIINTHTLDPTPDCLADPLPVSYDGEKTRSRVARREERWSPVTAVPW